MKLFQTKISDSAIGRITTTLKSGNLGFGPDVNLMEERFTDFSSKEYNVGVNSASGAAFMIFAYLKEKYGSCDVYTTSIGFTSPAWAAKHHGHNLIWVEVDENLLFDLDDYREKRRWRCERYTDGGIKPVLMPILYGGVSNIKGFDTLSEDNYNEIVVVDSAHCVTPKIKSDFTFFSFHPYKPIAASDGGMISTDDKSASEWFKSYRNFGRQNVDGTYDIVMDGFKFYMNNLNASIALTQLDSYGGNLAIRKQNHLHLQDMGLSGRLLPHDFNSSYYFATLISDEGNVDELYEKYPTSKHYPMLHKTKYFEDGTELPFTEQIHRLILNLPLYENIYNS
jgi:dTDP-4-amino-4,6-dideoxygalactose transaminase